MIHVPDVRVAMEWYQTIGFTVRGVHDDEGEMTWAVVCLGEGELMFNAGGRTSQAHRREVDLYVATEGVDDLYQRLKGRVELVEALHDTFYGMREFIIRDCNGFWITFGEPIE